MEKRKREEGWKKKLQGEERKRQEERGIEANEGGENKCVNERSKKSKWGKQNSVFCQISVLGAFEIRNEK